MESTEIYARLTVILREVFGNPDFVAHPNLTKDDVEEWDSLNHIRLIVSVEQAFQIQFSPLEILTLTKISDLVYRIQSSLAAPVRPNSAPPTILKPPEHGEGAS